MVMMKVTNCNYTFEILIAFIEFLTFPKCDKYHYLAGIGIGHKDAEDTTESSKADEACRVFS
jgi:hypothetical protein